MNPRRHPQKVDPTVRLNIPITYNKKKLAKIAAAKAGVTLQDFVLTAIREKIGREA